MASHKSLVDRRIDIADRRINLISRKREILGLSTLESEYVPPKSSTQLYEDCIKSVELEFGKYSKKFSVFKKLIQDCKEQRNFCNAVLPSLYPASTTEEVDRANQFICNLEVAFPNSQKRCDLAENLIVKFQYGILRLKDMTVEMLKLLENRDDLIEAYIRFVPQAERVIADITSTRRFNLYHTLLAVIVAFGIGIYTMNK